MARPIPKRINDAVDVGPDLKSKFTEKLVESQLNCCMEKINKSNFNLASFNQMQDIESGPLSPMIPYWRRYL